MTELEHVVRLGPQRPIRPVPAPACPPPADNSIASRMGTRQGRSAGKGNFTGVKQTVKADLLNEWWLDNTNKSLCVMVVQTEFNSLSLHCLLHTESRGKGGAKGTKYLRSSSHLPPGIPVEQAHPLHELVAGL